MNLAKLLFLSTVLGEDCQLYYYISADGSKAFIEDRTINCPNRTILFKDAIMDQIVATSCFTGSNDFKTVDCLW